MSDTIENTPRLKEAKFFYDFAVDGGAIGTLNLRGDNRIPAGAYVVGGFLDVLTQLTSGGAATIGAQIEAAGDLVSNATAVATWTAGVKNVKPQTASGDLTASNAVKTTAARAAAIVIAAFALTAGKFELTLFYR